MGGEYTVQVGKEELQTCCPNCRAPLKTAHTKLLCAACNSSFEIINGIPSLARNRDYYYGEIPRPLMTQLTTEISEAGWDVGFRRVLSRAKDPTWFIDYALREGRAGWMYLLPVHLKPRVLDVGCGPGAITFAFAQQGCPVAALDLTLERLKFVQLRSRELGLENVYPVHGGDTPYFPFPPDYFDLVILNGVLEWVPQTRRGNPKSAQVEFLREVGRILRPGGIVYIGIENRFSWNYILGQPEDHTGLKFVSLLPRIVANMYCRVRTGRAYTTHTYSLRGYNKLLRASGLCNAKTYLPMPDYREFSSVVEPSVPQTVRAFFAGGGRRRKVPAWAQDCLVTNLAPAFAILGAEHPDLKESLLTKALHALSEEWRTSGHELGEPVIQEYLVTRSDTALVRILWSDLRESWIVKFPMSKVSLESCTRQHENLRRLRSATGGPPSAFPEISEPIVSGHIEGIPYFVERALPGVSGKRLVLREHHPDVWLGRATEFLIRFHRSVLKDKIRRQEDVAPRIESMIATLMPFSSPESVSPLQGIKDLVVESLADRVLPHVITHGDFWLGNLLFDSRQERLTGVVDWDRASFGVVSVSDILHLILYTKSEASGVSVPTAVLGFAGDKSRDQAYEKFLTPYCEAIGLEFDSKLRAAFGIVYWLEFLYYQLALPRARFRFDPKWIQENLLDPIPELYNLARAAT